MLYITIGVVFLLLLVAGIVYAAGDLLSELHYSFLYIIATFLFLFIGAAIYLSYAVPSFASSSIFGASQSNKEITQDSIKGIELLPD